MGTFRLTILLFLITGSTFARQVDADRQRHEIDSLKHELELTQNDTLRLVLLTVLGGKYQDKKLDSSLYYARQLLPIARKLNYKIDEAYAMDCNGYNMYQMNDPATLEMLLKAMKLAENPGIEENILPREYLDKIEYYNGNCIPKYLWTPHTLRFEMLGSIYGDLGHFYGINMENRKEQLKYYFKARDIFIAVKDSATLATIYGFIGDTYATLNMLDSGLLYAQKSYNLRLQIGQHKWLGIPLTIIGNIYFKQGNYPLALQTLRDAIQIAAADNQFAPLSRAEIIIAKIFLKEKSTDSSIFYLNEAFENAKLANENFLLLESGTLLALAYNLAHDDKSALKYFELSQILRDSINNVENARKFQSEVYDEQIYQQQLETAQAEYKNRIKYYLLFAGLGVLLIIALILFRNNRQRKKMNLILQRKKNEIEKTLTDLKATQKQLIQSEKMASLGELTAGIAHEIQNPLNFVNNFSEVSNELISEMVEEVDKGNTTEIKALAENVKQNIEKILHHGKRAESIVKGMLQHSRTSTGKKEHTDINVLADECLRLSYHGLRAKDKSFNAEMKTDFDETIEKINVVPQDIGRVLLNLFNNAFYAVAERQKTEGEGYKPLVSVSIKKINDKVEIWVRDNGSGIPQKIIDKIYQPFFTTKPTGQGTGLGLSLSYDIIKAHGGEIKVNTREGEGSEFVIQIPV